MAAPVILQSDNEGDGRNILVTLQAAPVLPSFKVSRLPGIPGNTVSFATVDATHYRVQARATITPVRHFIWITAYDGVEEGNQDGDWILPGPLALGRMGLTLNAVHQILRDNALALDRALQISRGRRTWDDSRMPVQFEKIIKGLPPFEREGKNPVLSVRLPNWNEDLFFGLPYTDLEHYEGIIEVSMTHSGEEAFEDFVRDGAEGIKDILNTLQYLDGYVIVQTGDANRMVLSKLYCGSIRTNEFENPDLGVWVAQAEIPWTCEISASYAV